MESNLLDLCLGLESIRLTANTIATLHSKSSLCKTMSRSTTFQPDTNDPYAPSHPAIMGLCTIHGLSNCGTTKDEAKSAAVAWARAPTQQLADHCLKQLEEVSSPTIAQKMKERKSDMTFLEYMKQGLITNRELVSINPSEQQHWHDISEEIRKIPLTDRILKHLSNTSKKSSECKLYLYFPIYQLVELPLNDFLMRPE